MDDQRGGTRVFKKTSPNGQITTYLGKRDFIDHQTHVDIIDGMILIEQESLNRKVYASLNAAFRYGREDLDVLGLQFRKDLISMAVCVYAPSNADVAAEVCAADLKPGAASSLTDKSRPLTRLQERLKKKLGQNAYPFWFEIPPNAASSVTLQPAPGDTGKPCGVDYELITFVGDNAQEKPKKQGCVRLAIRKLTYAAFDKTRPQPSVELTREFMMSSGLLHIEATLDKEMYYHGESISVNVHVQNNSNKTVKKIKTAIIQIADICLFTTATYTCEVAKLESSEGCPVEPGSTLSKVYTLCPLLHNNKDKRGLALDGKLKHEDSNLASSTFLNDGVLVENLGIVIQYKVKIKFYMGGALTTDPQVELPFTLTHPKPPVSPRSSQINLTPMAFDAAPLTPVVDMDLIQLDTNASGGAFDDDIVFEDFARLRLKGMDSEDKEIF